MVLGMIVGIYIGILLNGMISHFFYLGNEYDFRAILD